MRLAAATVMSALVLGGCATTYNMPLEERSRVYELAFDDVWEAAVASVDDAGMALTETEREHGRIRARSGPTIWDFKGHVLVVVVTELREGRVRVDANAETFSEDEDIDFGRSARFVREYLNALDERLGW
jgi:hypothetical protein